MTRDEISLQLVELEAARRIPSYLDVQCNQLRGRLNRTTERLELDPDGTLYLITIDPCEDDEDSRRLGPIEEVSCRRIPDELWERYDELLASWEADGEQARRDRAGLEAEFRAGKGV